MDALERLALEHRADPGVLRAPVPGAEQPAIGVEALAAARVEHLGERRLRMLAQMGEQPELERVNLREVAAVLERPARRIGLRVELRDQIVGEPGLGQQRGEARAELREVGGGVDGADRRRDRLRRRLAMLVEPRERSIGLETGEARVCLRQEDAALRVGEQPEVGAAARVVGGRGEDRVGIELRRHQVVAHVGHQADEHEVHRALERLAHARTPLVVGLVEVGEAVLAAAGEEHGVRARGVAALERVVEHLGERRGGVEDHLLLDPATEPIRARRRECSALRDRHRGEPVVLLGDQLEIGHERAQLRGRAEVELHAVGEVERAVGVVDLGAQPVGVRTALVHVQAEFHAVGEAGVEQPQAEEARRRGDLRIAEPRDALAEQLLGADVERAVDAEVEAVEIVEAAGAEHRGEARAHGAREPAREPVVVAVRFARAVGGEVHRERGVAQLRADHPRAREPRQVGARLREQVVGVLEQQRGRAPLCDEEREREHVGARDLLAVAVVEFDRRREPAVHVFDAHAVPGGQPVAQPDHLAAARNRRERHSVHVVDDDLPARGHREVAAVIGAQTRQEHLAQLLARRARDALGRVPELFDLRGERAAARAARSGRGRERLHQAIPLDRRVAARRRAIEQLAVLDEQQRRDENRRDVLEARVRARGLRGLEQRRARAVADVQARLRLLVIGREQTEARDPRERVVRASLRDDVESLRVEQRDAVAQSGVSHPAVVRPGRRREVPARRARPHFERCVARCAVEEIRLEAERAHLPRCEHAESDRDQEQQRDADAEPPDAASPDLGQAGRDVAGARRLRIYKRKRLDLRHVTAPAHADPAVRLAT